MNALVWLKGELKRDSFADESVGDPGLALSEAQTEAGPLMLMVRRANMRLSIAAGRRIAKPHGDRCHV